MLASIRAINLSSRFHYRMCSVAGPVGLCRDSYFFICFLIKIYMIIFGMTSKNQCNRNPYPNPKRLSRIALGTSRIQCALLRLLLKYCGWFIYMFGGVFKREMAGHLPTFGATS
jgi:hypothetical protein